MLESPAIYAMLPMERAELIFSLMETNESLSITTEKGVLAVDVRPR